MFGMSGEMPKGKAEKNNSNTEVQDDIDLGFASGIEDEEGVGSVWSEDDAAAARKLLNEFVEHEPPIGELAPQVILPNVIDHLWPETDEAKREEMIKDFSLAYKALRAGRTPMSKITPGDVMRILTIGREIQDEIAGKG